MGRAACTFSGSWGVGDGEGTADGGGDGDAVGDGEGVTDGDGEGVFGFVEEDEAAKHAVKLREEANEHGGDDDLRRVLPEREEAVVDVD